MTLDENWSALQRTTAGPARGRDRAMLDYVAQLTKDATASRVKITTIALRGLMIVEFSDHLSFVVQLHQPFGRRASASGGLRAQS